MRIQCRHSYLWIDVAEIIFKSVIKQVNRLKYTANRKLMPHFEQCLMDSRQRDFERTGYEHHGFGLGIASFCKKLGVAGPFRSRHFPACLAYRRGYYCVDDAVFSGVDGVGTEFQRGFAANGAWFSDPRR